jgi:hypothetical protein
MVSLSLVYTWVRETDAVLLIRNSSQNTWTRTRGSNALVRYHSVAVEPLTEAQVWTMVHTSGCTLLLSPHQRHDCGDVPLFLACFPVFLSWFRTGNAVTAALYRCQDDSVGRKGVSNDLLPNCRVARWLRKLNSVGVRTVLELTPDTG